MVSKINNETGVNGRENWTSKGLPLRLLLYLLCLAQGWKIIAQMINDKKEIKTLNANQNLMKKNNFEGKVDL